MQPFTNWLLKRSSNDHGRAGYELAPHNARSIDLVATDGKHVQVKVIGSKRGFAAIYAGRDLATEVVVITSYGDRDRYFCMPMGTFKTIAMKYDKKGRAIPAEQPPEMWTIGPAQINKGLVSEYELFPFLPPEPLLPG